MNYYMPNVLYYAYGFETNQLLMTYMNKCIVWSKYTMKIFFISIEYTLKTSICIDVLVIITFILK